MDLLDFTDCNLYFEDPLPAEAEAALNQAAAEYGEPGAEAALLRAYALAPRNLTVLVGLYRFYFYQHRMEDALDVAEQAMNVSGQTLGLPPSWRQLDAGCVASAAADGRFALLRFYLLALKAASIVLLRMRRIAEARERLETIAALDSKDHLDSAKLLELINEFHDLPEDAAALAA
jgi:tetratricopeptide (TPR) repeat protein